jgi:nucleoside-diphosphate-sugar epimerase
VDSPGVRSIGPEAALGSCHRGSLTVATRRPPPTSCAVHGGQARCDSASDASRFLIGLVILFRDPRYAVCSEARGYRVGVRAFVIGGTGLVGRAVSRQLLAGGWQIEVLGRDRRHLPDDLADAGVRFTSVDREDASALTAAFGGGADLLVDCVCFTRGHARALLPLARHASSTVMISSKAVYVDANGNHSNSEQPTRFDAPITESQATLPPGDMPYNSRLGYGRNKVAAERVLVDSGLPVSVLRASKIHGEGARPPREWIFVKRVLDRRRVVLLAQRGRGVDHPSAAVNIAALVETVANQPGARILNAADPDAPSALEIARIVAGHLGHDWSEVLLDENADPPLGWHPWDRRYPVVLDTSAAAQLGYQPSGDYQTTVGPALDWLVELAEQDGVARLPERYDDGYFDGRFDYTAEDRYLGDRTGRPGDRSGRK